MKFKKTLMLNSGPRRSSNDDSSENGNSNLSIKIENCRSDSSNIEQDGQSRKIDDQVLSCANLDSLDPGVNGQFSHSYAGLSGKFVPLRNDFSTNYGQQNDEFDNDDDYVLQLHGSSKTARYRDELHWPAQKREKVKRFRFVICLLALFGLALGLMSRLMLNVSIVEMVKQPPEVNSVEELTINTNEGVVQSRDEVVQSERVSASPLPIEESSTPTTDPLLFAAEFDQNSTPVSAEYLTDSPDPSVSPDVPDSLETSLAEESAGDSHTQQHEESQISHAQQHEEDDGLRFNWSKQDVNLVLGSLYLGYMPGILFSGDIAQRYGAKYPLFFCIFGTAVINVLTPTIARFSLNLLIASRILLGLIQGSLLPALYELFNRWLTQTESSIFAPMIKVSMPLGSLIGVLLPGILASYKLAWPNLFYLGGLVCFLWSLVWLFLATSLPQTNRFIEQNEVERIMRKKGSVAKLHIVSTNISKHRPEHTGKATQKLQPSPSPAKPKKATPWLQIITSPSVLALTLVKFTYNIGMDFIFLQLAVYLREVHHAPIETISAIASGSYCMQMVLISFVGWVAKIVVLKRSLGLSVTKWRKLFQGGSNILMAASYLVLAYLNPGIELSTCLILCVAFFWMLGAGGESMIPYDLSAKYPASIVGFAHSVSITSGIAMTAICGIVLGENTADSSRWSLLFLMLSGLLAFGGLVFVLVVKAKPFLPGERVLKPTTRNGTNNNDNTGAKSGSILVNSPANINGLK